MAKPPHDSRLPGSPGDPSSGERTQVDARRLRRRPSTSDAEVNEREASDPADDADRESPEASVDLERPMVEVRAQELMLRETIARRGAVSLVSPPQRPADALRWVRIHQVRCSAEGLSVRRVGADRLGFAGTARSEGRVRLWAEEREWQVDVLPGDRAFEVARRLKRRLREAHEVELTRDGERSVLHIGKPRRR